MSLHDRLLNLKKREIADKGRRISQIEHMLDELNDLGRMLTHEIIAEQNRSRVHDPADIAYSTYATATLKRCKNVRRSTNQLQKQLATLKESLGEAIDDLKTLERLRAHDGPPPNEPQTAKEHESSHAQTT